MPASTLRRERYHRAVRSRLALVALIAAACAHRPPSAPAPPPAAPAPGAPDTIDEADRALQAAVRFIDSAPIDQAPWSSPVFAGTAEVKTALEAAGAGRAQPADLASPLVIGSALWALLVKLDPALAEAGTSSINALPHRTGPKQTMEVRSFMHEPERAALLRSPGFRKIGRAFAQANVRAAKRAERRLFYLLVPFEITAQAVTIAEREADRLVVFLDDQRRIAWLDVLSAYDTSAGH